MSKLTRSKFYEVIESIEEIITTDDVAEALESQGYFFPDPPEPKKLTVIEAAAEIGKGNRVKDCRGYEYPKDNGSVNLLHDCGPFIIVDPPKKTIEIDDEVIVHVLRSGGWLLDAKPDDLSGIDVVAIERFELKRVVEVE